jgi:hypothetical protein
VNYENSLQEKMVAWRRKKFLQQLLYRGRVD